MRHAISVADTAAIMAVWEARWGIPVVTPGGVYHPADVEGLQLLDRDRSTLALASWTRSEGGVELVSLDAMVTGRGLGSRILRAAEEQLAREGERILRLFTTGDNVRALSFYLHRGYRLVDVHLDAMEEVRLYKPHLPHFGEGGLPLRDAWELHKALGDLVGGVEVSYGRY